jgi:glutathione S-transferase
MANLCYSESHKAQSTSQSTCDILKHSCTIVPFCFKSSPHIASIAFAKHPHPKSHPHKHNKMHATPPPEDAKSEPYPRTTLWLWPTGLFPRRVIFYMRAKGLTTAILRARNIHLIPVKIVFQDPYPAIVSCPGYEARPEPHHSLPVMRIERDASAGGDFWIREAMGITQYLEEFFGTEEGYTNLMGSSIMQRVRARDVLNALADATGFCFNALIHLKPECCFFSGLKEEEMSKKGGEDARNRFHATLKKVEGWIEGDVCGEKGTMSVTGDGIAVTLADIHLGAQIMYAVEPYGTDWLEGHEVFQEWWARVKGKRFVVQRKDLLEVERSGKWEGVLDV